MATRTYQQQLSSGGSTATTNASSSTWVDNVTASFSLDASSTYLILGYCESQCNNSTAADTQLRLYDGTTALCSANTRHVSSDASEWIPFNLVALITTTGAVSPTLAIQHKLSSTAASRLSSARNGVIFALKLGANDVSFSNDVAGTSTANPGAWTDYNPASGTKVLTFTPPSTGDYLIFAFCTETYSSAADGNVIALLCEDGTTRAMTAYQVPNTTSNKLSYAATVRRTGLTAVAQTFKLQHARQRSATGTSTLDQVRMVALRLADFDASTHTEDLTTRTTTSATYVDLGTTQTDTLTNAIDYLLLGSWWEGTNNNSILHSSKLTDGTNTYNESQRKELYHAAEPNWGQAIVVPRKITGTGASLTHKVQGKITSVLTLTETEKRLHLLQLQSSGAPASVTVPAAVAAVSSVPAVTTSSGPTVTLLTPVQAISTTWLYDTAGNPVLWDNGNHVMAPAGGAQPTIGLTWTTLRAQAVSGVGTPTITATGNPTALVAAAVSTVGTPTVGMTYAGMTAAAVSSVGQPGIGITTVSMTAAAISTVGQPGIGITTATMTVPAVSSVGTPTISVTGSPTAQVAAATSAVGTPTLTATGNPAATGAAATSTAASPTISATGQPTALVAAAVSGAASTWAYGITYAGMTAGAVSSVPTVTISTTKTADLIDTFDTAINSPPWRYNNLVTVVGGRARFEVRSDYSSAMHTDTDVYDLTDSHYFFQAFPDPSTTSTRQLILQLLDHESASVLQISKSGGGMALENTGINAAVDYVGYDATNDAWWQIRADATNVYWETSPDGSTWTTKRTKSFATLGWKPTSVRPAITVGYYGTESTPFYVYVDNVNTVVPAGISTAAAVSGAASPTISATANPAALVAAAVSTVGTPTISTTAGAPDLVAAAVSSVGTPTLSATANPAPSSVAASSAVGTPTVTASADVATFVGPWVYDANGDPVLMGDGSHLTWSTPGAAWSQAATFPAGIVSVSQAATALVAAATSAVGTPTISATGQPTALVAAAVSGVGTPSLQLGSDITANALVAAATSTAASPTVSATANVAATGAPATSTAASPSGAVEAYPPGAAAVSVAASPTVSASATATATGAAAVSSVGTPTVTATVGAAPAPVAAVSSVGTPTLTATADVTAIGAAAISSAAAPTVVTVAMTAGAISGVGTPTISTAGADTNVTVPAPVAAVSGAASPTTIHPTNVTPDTARADSVIARTAQIQATGNAPAQTAAAISTVTNPTVFAGQGATVNAQTAAAVSTAASPQGGPGAIPLTAAAHSTVGTPTLAWTAEPTPTPAAAVSVAGSPSISVSALVPGSTAVAVSGVGTVTIGTTVQLPILGVAARSGVGTPTIATSGNATAQTAVARSVPPGPPIYLQLGEPLTAIDTRITLTLAATRAVLTVVLTDVALAPSTTRALITEPETDVDPGSGRVLVRVE